MKTMYKVIGDKVYNIEQSMSTPQQTYPKTMTTHVLTSFDQGTYSAHAFINGLSIDSQMTNKELFDKLTEKIVTDNVKEINTIYDKYKVYLDYSIIDSKGNVIEHSVTIQKLNSKDVIVPLGINVENECQYSQAKLFKQKLEFTTKTTVPVGSIRIPPTSPNEYRFMINDIVIFQSFIEQDEVHESIFNTAYNYGSSTIQSTLNTMAAIYSTKKEGIYLAEFVLPKLPRKIEVNVEVLLGDYIIVYDDSVIISLLETNNAPENVLIGGLISEIVSEEENTES